MSLLKKKKGIDGYVAKDEHGFYIGEKVNVDFGKISKDTIFFINEKRDSRIYELAFYSGKQSDFDLLGGSGACHVAYLNKIRR